MAQRRTRTDTDDADRGSGSHRGPVAIRGSGRGDGNDAVSGSVSTGAASTRRTGRSRAGDASLTSRPDTGDTLRFEVETPSGVAEVVVDLPPRRARGPIARGLVALGHGASGGVDAPDLVAVRHAAVAAGLAVARITQPYRVLGRKAPPAAPVLDTAWTAAVTETRRRVGAKLPLVVGGRSSGARVASRTGVALGASGVLALAFPLHPPGKPDKSRAGELDPAQPTLVINGDRDPFGVPDAAGQVRVEIRPGNQHDLRKDTAGTAEIAITWIRGLLKLA
jgi:predicted alpha/beta-hydrolase family hydrolase